jgi:hypothetical protein
MNSGDLVRKAVENWPVKVLSIALALILVVFHRMSTLEDRFFSVPLNLEGDETLTPSASYVRTVRVTLRGDPNSIYPIGEDDIEAFIDLSKYGKPGTYRAPVQVRKKGSALGVEPLEISVDPLEAVVELDVKISKSVPLRPNFRGSVENGYQLSSYTMTPVQVTIEGPQNLAGAITELTTEVIDLDGREEDFSLSTAVVNRDPLVLIRGRGTVEFRGTVREQLTTREFAGVPIAPRGLDGRFTALPEPAEGSLRLQGGRWTLGNYLPPEDFLALDCSGIQSPGTYTLPVLVNTDPSFDLLSQEPVEALVEVSLRPPEEGEGAGP